MSAPDFESQVSTTSRIPSSYYQVPSIDYFILITQLTFFLLSIPYCLYIYIYVCDDVIFIFITSIIPEKS